MTDPHRADIDAAFNDIVRTELAAEQGPMCDCQCDRGTLNRHADRRCGQRATRLVALHMWGCCDVPDKVNPAAVDADGNLCVLMCPRCALHALNVAEAKIRHLFASMPAGITPRCPTCGRPTEQVSDLCEIRSL